MGSVIRLKDPARAFWLTRSVARSAGVNLGNALATGRIDAAEYADMVVCRRRCGLTAACEAWLGRSPRSELAPAGCHHAAMIHKLAHHQS
jgi:hypothetical protein